MEPKDGRLRIGDPFGPARPSDDDESSSWPSPTSRGTKRGRDIVGGSDATERSERFVAEVDMLLICVSAEKLRDRLPHATGGGPRDNTNTPTLYNNKVRCRRAHVTATASITTPPVAKNAPAPARPDTFCPK